MLNPLYIEDFVRKALLEDLGGGRDVTSDLLIPGDKIARGVLRARQAGIVAGLAPALTAFSLSDPDFSFEIMLNDGDFVSDGGDIAVIEGPARPMLTAERTALNILSHLSGIATMTALYAQEVARVKAKARITCTRKTLPGLRVFQKYAVEVGGGSPHRYSLNDAILIKDNHIYAAGGIKVALGNIKKHAGHMLTVEIEVETLKQLEEVLKVGGADVVLLDNMSPATLKKAVAMARGKLVTEASGGVNLDNVAQIAKTGVDYISVGALTHSAQALDIGLDVEI